MENNTDKIIFKTLITIIIGLLYALGFHAAFDTHDYFDMTAGFGFGSIVLLMAIKVYRDNFNN